MWRKAPSLLFTFMVLPAVAQEGPALAVDAAMNLHPISPDIYGINDYLAPGLNVQAAIRVPVRRFGGDATSRYNWKDDNTNSGSDYYFENGSYYGGTDAALPAGIAYFENMVANDHLTRTKSLGTIPILGWTTKGLGFACSFSVTKYGMQDKVDPYNPDCGNGQRAGQWLTGTDPHDTSTEVDESFYAPWIEHLIATYGPASKGGVEIWSLDNEPEWWMDVHHDIHPTPATYDEMLSRNTKVAQIIKAADATALVTGPVPAGWWGYFDSATDFAWNAEGQFDPNPVDRDAHGGRAWLDYYLQQMHAYEVQHGQRLVDYLDLHAYVTPNNIAFGEATDEATSQLRLTSTRALWDPSYLVPDVDPTTPIRLIPRMRDWVNNNYPGTKIAITEYNWGALDDITGTLAQADILGIFGRESLDLGTIWGPPTAGQPGVFAFEIYNNYDGQGGAFGSTSVLATTANPDQLSMFAALRSDMTLTVIVINKTTGNLNSTVSLANFESAGSAHAYQYSSANLNAIVKAPDISVSAQGINATFPAYSITLFEIPAASSAFSVPKPVVGAVVNAASYVSGVAPGEMVTIFGTGMGPSQIQHLALDSNGLLSNSVTDVRVLFDGVPSPIIYVSANQCAVMVPYFVANLTTAHVQVEYQGSRSDALEIPVVASSPGVFTLNQQGTGQGAIRNEDGVTANGPLAPAPRGSIVSLYLTGEGQTNPPGFDGKLAAQILPKPVLPVTVTIGGIEAQVAYVGAAPDLVAGMMQVNVHVPMKVTPGLGPLTVKVGGVASASDVTLAVQ